MFTQLVRQNLVLFLIFSTVLRAEIPGLPPPRIPGPDNSAPATTIPEAPVTPPPQPSDRKGGASAAQGLAAAAAGIALGMCAMMMAQAQQMPPGPEKNQMMMQAMQQCAQAAQNAKNAGDNGKAKDAVANNTTPTGQQQTAKNPGNSKGAPQTPAANASETPEVASEIPSLSEPSLTDPSAIPEPVDVAGSTDFGSSFASSNGVSTPNSIESSEVGFNETNKGNESKINPSGSANFGGAGSGNLTAAAASGAGAEGKGESKRKTGAHEGEAGDSSSDGSGSASGSGAGPTAFDKMLSDIMGGKQEPIPVFGANSDILLLRNAGEKKMTIFQLANSRYRRAGYSEGLVDIRKPGRFREPASIPKIP